MAEENGDKRPVIGAKRVMADIRIALLEDMTFHIDGSMPSASVGLALAHILLDYALKRWEDETRAKIIAPVPGSFAWDPNRPRQ